MRLVILAVFLILTGTVTSSDLISARQNFFNTVRQNPASAAAYLENKDPEIRRYALYLVIKQNPEAALKYIEKMYQDSDAQVRKMAVSPLPSLSKKNKKALQILRDVAAKEKDMSIRKIALQSLWPFHREIKLLRNDPTWDYEVKVIKSIPLQNLPWLFTTDARQDGHNKGFYKVNHDVSSWKKIRMGVWEKQGFADYDGAAWYQIRFTMPKKIDSNAVEIVFDGVDESAWVWLNGIYLGAHDIGPEGWNVPFAVDCRKEIKWGAENILTVRVYDAAFAGGIYKPVRVDILK